MKGLVLALIAFVNAGSFLQGQAVGEPCMKSPSFVISSFIVDPWPLYLNQAYSISVFGTFKNSELLNQLTVGVKREFSWNNTIFYVDKSFPEGTNHTFSYKLQGPVDKGRYTEQVTLNRQDYSIVACWEFKYQIS